VSEVLAVARRMRYDVGSNLGGGGPAAPWTLLLPRLDADAAIVLGRIDDAERSAMGRLFHGLVTIEADRATSAAELLDQRLHGRRLDAVRIGAGVEGLARASDAVTRRVAAQEAPLPLIYRECMDARAGDRESGLLSDDALRLTVRKESGQPMVVAPSDEPIVAAWLARSGWLERRGRVSLRKPRASLRVLAARFAGRSPDHGHLGGPPLAELRQPPRYVIDVAAADGATIDQARWALVAPGHYATQKALLFLFSGAGPDPEIVVKLAPDAAQPERLLNEGATLRRLGALDLPHGRVPVLRFAGTHAGRGVVGEEWIRGRPFHDAARASEDCPHLEAAAAWLTGLARATRSWRPAGEVAAALGDLLDRFVAVHPGAATERNFLSEQVERIGRHPGDLPVVTQHGDPGAWNLLVDDDARVVFLDWESSEETGMPVWDLSYFQRSYGALASQREGGGRRLEMASRHFLESTPLQRRFTRQLAEYAAAVGVPLPIVEPLFYLCWMHRALKEATRRPASRLESGHFRRLLGHLVRHRDAPALKRMLSGEVA
jgi:Ser/Thr protein kinase RdoA (MazF antagonist)